MNLAAHSTAAVPDPSSDLAHAQATPKLKPGIEHSLSELLGRCRIAPADVSALEAISTVQEVRFGQALFTRAEAATDLIWLHQGSASLGLLGTDGTFHSERTVNAPGWLDQSSAWLGQGHAMDAQANSLCVVVSWPVATLRQVLRDRPELTLGVIAALAGEVNALSASTHELMHKDAPARLASWLVQHCEPLTGDVRRAVVHLQGRKRDLASQLAITPETLSRLMRTFSRRGLIAVTGYTVHVSDLGALQLLALI